jgi:putative tricarboxylic transport membrane protein
MEDVMKKRYFSILIAGIVSMFLILPISFTAIADTMVKEVHFVIPGGAGGGWDTTARGVGRVLQSTGIVGNASFENMSGGGGGKAINHMISTAKRQQNTLMVNSTPIVIRSLQGVFPQSFRDLTPVASVIADFAAFVVAKDSKYTSFKQIIADFKKDPRSVKVAGGSVKGSMDHIVPAMAIEAAGGDPLKLVYVPYDAGGKAMAGLLSGDTQVLSTGFGEAANLASQGEVRILAVTAGKRLAEAPDVQTLKELGIDVEFANWRGFFGPPNLPKSKVKAYLAMFEKMYSTPEWEATRKKYGWQNLYNPGDEFITFLEGQEKAVGKMMRNLGFLK